MINVMTARSIDEHEEIFYKELFICCLFSGAEFFFHTGDMFIQ